MKHKYAEAILKLRARLNISQTELAKILGVSFSSVNRWEKGYHEPTIIVKVRLQELFNKNGIDLNYNESNKL